MGRAVVGSPAGSLPVGDGRLSEARLRVVIREQFGLGCNGLGEACLQDLCNALVILSAGALEHGLIGGVLDQSVLEGVRTDRPSVRLIEQLCRLQVREALVEYLLRHIYTVLQ